MHTRGPRAPKLSEGPELNASLGKRRKKKRRDVSYWFTRYGGDVVAQGFPAWDAIIQARRYHLVQWVKE